MFFKSILIEHYCVQASYCFFLQEFKSPVHVPAVIPSFSSNAAHFTCMLAFCWYYYYVLSSHRNYNFISKGISLYFKKDKHWLSSLCFLSIYPLYWKNTNIYPLTICTCLLNLQKQTEVKCIKSPFLESFLKLDVSISTV